MAQEPYLRSLAVLVLLGTLSAALIDYVFKAHAVATFQQGEGLLRFFAIFYMVIGLLTFLLQTALGRVSLEKLGLAKTVATLPGAVVVGALGVFFAPGLARRLRGSGLRSGPAQFLVPFRLRPLLYADLAAGKTRYQVFDRRGVSTAGGMPWRRNGPPALVSGTQLAQSAMLISAALIAGVGMVVARNLHQGYIGALERSLRNRAVELDLSEVADKTTAKPWYRPWSPLI